MPKATDKTADLVKIKNCYVFIPNFGMIDLYALPDISDSKSASYHDEIIMGRSSPLKTYSQSENRAISMQLHFYIRKKDDIQQNINYLNALRSAVYPREGGATFPYLPPPICKIKCGCLLDGEPLCVILKSYTVRFPTDVAWDSNFLIPYKFDVDTNWETVYKTTDLPGQEKILSTGNSCATGEPNSGGGANLANI